MRVLIIHPEAEYFAGAEKMLGYYLEGLLSTGHDVTVAAVRESRVAEIIPKELKTCWLPPNSRFSLPAFLQQVRALSHLHRVTRFDVIHGWAARDWELTALASKWIRRPALGTLHDHPRAPFISRSRQRLMRWAAGLGLGQIACVSGAVRQACLAANYPSAKLRVVHNGLPPMLSASKVRDRVGAPFRIGFLGMFSERKGLRGLFEIVDAFARGTTQPWELALAGDAQEAFGRQLVQELRARYAQRAWWGQVQWLGWVKHPAEFLASLDLLVCPSSEFDPFPTVLLEAGRAGVPVLGAKVGGVSEIIADGETGWLFEPPDWSLAAVQLQKVVQTPELLAAAGHAAKKRVEREFTIERMVAVYLGMYTDVADPK